MIYWSGNSGHTVYLNNIQIYRETSFKQVSIICKECISLQRKNPENLLVVNTNGKIHDTDHKSETILKWNKRTNRKLNVGKKRKHIRCEYFFGKVLIVRPGQTDFLLALNLFVTLCEYFRFVICGLDRRKASAITTATKKRKPNG